ncbi:hypothetical protein [Alicyclobacillus tolerans]|uniref:Uncharacterized protein n=1 Tax=Alicyclobacillus tolerans TaxID=90970 RepID=A0A1M6UCR4_9BACL|nr:hypothetical protein [Alicyclobacillus montanus]SHK67022.1 hypothetical protein SAMN05443507_11945 [Alicyclobacillus montanus]
MQQESLRLVNSNGQISIGKKYAGKTFSVIDMGDGILQLKEGTFIPKSEEWLFEPDVSEDLKRAIEWAEHHEPKETDLEELGKQVPNDDEC